MNELQHFLAEVASGHGEKGECLTCPGTLLDRDNQPLAKVEVIFYTLARYGSCTLIQLLKDEDYLLKHVASVRLSTEPAIVVRNFQKCATEAAPIHYDFDYLSGWFAFSFMKNKLVEMCGLLLRCMAAIFMLASVLVISFLIFNSLIRPVFGLFKRIF